MARKINKQRIKFKDNNRSGGYYISGGRKMILKEVRDLRERIPDVKWNVIKFKVPAWIKKK